jgi:hypothetical protein
MNATTHRPDRVNVAVLVSRLHQQRGCVFQDGGTRPGKRPRRVHALLVAFPFIPCTDLEPRAGPAGQPLGEPEPNDVSPVGRMSLCA